MVISKEQAGLVRRRFERLPDHCREVVRLRLEEGMSFEEIGQTTSRSADAARKVWKRAIAELGRKLGV